MNRQNITDGENHTIGWFDKDRAKEYGEDTWWNGSNQISMATGSQWEHEELYLTAGGAWVLHWWSQYQGSSAIYTRVSQTDAFDWLVKNERWEPELPAAINTVWVKYLAKAEV